MEENNQTTPTAPQGKGMAIAGFVISLVGLVFYFIIAGIVGLAAVLGGGYGLGIFWLILCLAGTLLSAMGMMKLGKTGGKKGLGIAGLVIGLVATIMTLMLVMGISKIHEQVGDKVNDAGKEFLEAIQDTSKINELKRAIEDSLQSH